MIDNNSINLMLPDNYYTNILSDYSNKFILANVYSLRDRYFKEYINGEDYLLNTILIYLRANLDYILTLHTPYKDNTNTNEMIDNVDMVTDRKVQGDISYRVIKEFKKYFSNSYKEVMNKVFTVSDKFILTLAQLIFHNKNDHLLKLINHIDKKSEVFKEESDKLYKIIIDKTIPQFRKKFVTDVVEDYVKSIAIMIINDFSCFSIIDVKKITFYSYFPIYNDSNIKHNILNGLSDDYNNILKKYLTVDIVQLMMLLMAQEFKHNTINDLEYNMNSEFINLKKFETFFPGIRYQNLFTSLALVLVEYTDNSKTLYLPIHKHHLLYFNENDKVLLNKEQILRYLTHLNLVDEDDENSSHVHIVAPEIIFNGNIDDFFIEFNYYYNNILKDHFNFNIDNIRKYFEIEIEKGLMVDMHLGKEI